MPGGRSLSLSGLRRYTRLVALSGVLTGVPLVMGVPSLPTAHHSAPQAVKSHLRSVTMHAVSVAALRSQAARSDGAVPTPTPSPTPPPSTAPADPALAGVKAASETGAQPLPDAVSVIGVTWPRGAVSGADHFQIRTQQAGKWGTWDDLDVEADHGPDAGSVEAARAASRATDAYVVTGAQQFEVRSLSTDGTTPTAASVQVVDPGQSTAPVTTAAPGAATAAAARPTIYSRAQWGADESIRKGSPSYGQVQLAFVHHTVGTNTYTPDQVPAIIRGIYAYHVQGEGWSDIGYNYLVDRFGRIWEGRYGGVDRPVIGAQTLNYNSWSTGVSVLGNYQVAVPTQASVDAIKRLLAWKFTLSGIPATGTVVANGRTFNRISGHRDGFSTTCPGQYLYAKLPEIRSGVASLMGALPRTPVNRDIDGNGTPDALSYPSVGSSGTIGSPMHTLLSVQRQPVLNGVQIGRGWNILAGAGLSPDLNGDGLADVIARDPGANRMRIYLGDGRGGFKGVLYRGSGWNVMTQVLAAQDRDRDGHNDILGLTKAGDLAFYSGDGAGWVRGGVVIGRGWNALKDITTAGDLNHDGYPDLLATRRSDGMQIMYAGMAGGGVSQGVAWGSGWGSFSPVVGGADLDKDGNPDLIARSPNGTMSTYYSNAQGVSVRWNRWGGGWSGYTQLSTGADLNGDGAPDLLAVNSAADNGALVLYRGVPYRDFRTYDLGPNIPEANLVRIVGDVDGDGRTDAVARLTDGSLVLARGIAGGGFAAPVTIGTGFGAYPLLEAGGDLDYDGVPDLIARNSSGALLLFGLRRDLTMKAPTVIGQGWQGMRAVIGTGPFNPALDANGDVVALRESDRALIFYRGDGPTALQDAQVIAGPDNAVDQLLAVGDYNGDGLPDILVRLVDGTLGIYPGNGYGGVLPRQPVSGGEGAGHELG
jgi:hypothetical protein